MFAMTTPVETTHSPQDELLLAYLAEHEASCPVCGYNVHRITVPRCPECGRGLRLRLRTSDGFSRTWLITLMCAGVSAGIGGVMVCMIARWGPPPSREPVLAGVVWCYVASMPLPLVVFWLRRAYARWPIALRAVLMSVAVVLTVVMPVVFVIALNR